MSTETFTRLMTSLSDGMISDGFDFADMADSEFFSLAARYLETHDALTKLLSECDADIRKACLSYGEKFKMWGVNPTILRRELKLRGYYGV